jgi:taurine transport system substrate-binding protein
MRISAGRRRLGSVTSLALGAALLAGCASAKQAEQDAAADGGGQGSDCPVEANEDITGEARIAYQNIPNGDLLVRDQGWLEACMPNAQITWSRFNSGGDVVQAFGSDSVDLGLVGSSPATKAVSPPLDIDLQVIWIHDVIGDAESLVAQNGVTSVEGLADHTVAVPFASTAHFSLLSALDDAGLEPGTDVEVVNLSPDAMLAAWERGEIDAAWVWAPTLSTLQESGTDLLSSEDTAARGTPTFDLAAATTQFVEANPDFMSVWTAVQDHAVRQIQDEPEAAAESIAAQLGIEPAEVATQLAGYVYLTAEEQAGEDYFGGGMSEALMATAEFLATQREIDEVAPDQAYVDAVYAESIDEVAAG